VSLHDRLLQALRAVPQLQEIKLVAGIRDDGLNFPNQSDLRIFIPDMHLSSAAIARDYHYGFNCNDLFVGVAGALTALRLGRAAGETIEIYQIGDYLDLWREALEPPNDEQVAADIKADHTDIVDVFESGDLGVHFLLGNHDFDLWQWADYRGWDRRMYLPDGNDPAILVMHGDYFDWMEMLPEPVKDFVVHYLARLIEAPNEVMGKIMDWNHALNHGSDFSQAIHLPPPVVVGPGGPLPAAGPYRFNVQTAGGSLPGSLKYLDQAVAECAKVNAWIETDLRVVVIGHTHRARIATAQTAQGKLFTLIDTGAWIETCSEVAGGPTMPNAQITAISANEARIYQLVSK
jgi:UDP-2,3-diacylglucosamine pyrophosphatase LpxH